MIDPPPPVTGTRRNPTRADVQALYVRLVHSYGPPVDSAAVFAQAVAAAMWEALEIVEHARHALDADGGSIAPQFHEGHIYAANKIMRAVFDSLNPGKGCSAGLRLATRRGLCGLTQREVADAGHVERSHYARIESGQYKLKADHARLFAAVLGCTPEYLLTGEGGRP
jgi:DNA-binding XRE family transcriptional regulator